MGSKLGRFKRLFSPSDASTSQSGKDNKLSVLCPICLSILDEVMERAKTHIDGSNRQTFGRRMEWKRQFEVKKNLLELERAADDGCQFCYLRWEDLCDQTEASERLLAANETYNAGVYWMPTNPDAWKVALVYNVGQKRYSRFKFQSEVNQNHKSRTKKTAPADKDKLALESPAENQDPKWDIARTWLKNCTEGHTACTTHQETSSFLPTRLIHLGPGPTPQPRLCDSDSLARPTKYITLSHCWGKLPILRLLTTNTDALKHAIDPSQLCATFLDAMAATLQLGVHHLWIDSLCIQQDSAHDWATESASMHSVYAHAHCNLAASTAPDGSHGLYRHLAARNPCSAQAVRVAIRIKSRDVVFVGYNEALWLWQVDCGPLKSRAWVVQELVLAPRVLHFGRHQVFWDCVGLRACEALREGSPAGQFQVMNGVAPGCILAPEKFKNESKLKGKDAFLWSRIAQWMELVEEYSKCKLTVESDRLVAISGLAKAMKLDVGYWAGLWGAFVGKQILWQISEVNTWRGSSTSAPAPSWSWAAPLASIEFKYRRWGDEDRGVLTVIDVKVSLVSEDPTGAVSGGRMRVEGGLARAKRDYRWTDLHLDFGNEDDPLGDFYLLPIMCQAYAEDYTGLILEPTEEGDGKYRRRGWFMTRFHTLHTRLAQTLKDPQNSFRDKCCDSIKTLTTKHYESSRESPEFGHIFTITLI